MALHAPEEVAKEYMDSRGYISIMRMSLAEAIKLDRSRMVQYIREKMPKKEDMRKLNIDGFERGEKLGWNSCIEAVEKILEEVK